MESGTDTPPRRTGIPDISLTTRDNSFIKERPFTETCGSQPTSDFRTVGRMDAAVERTGSIQRVLKAEVG